MERLIHEVLLRWQSVPMASLPEEVADHLQERVEELFVEASMLEAVRLNTVCLDDLAMRFHPTGCLLWTTNLIDLITNLTYMT